MLPPMKRSLSRRRLLQSACAAGGASLWPGTGTAAPDGLRIAPFRFEVTPPPGHPLCGGWITPVVDVEDSLEAIGFVLLGAGDPVVVCAVDWTGILDVKVGSCETLHSYGLSCKRDRGCECGVVENRAPKLSWSVMRGAWGERGRSRSLFTDRKSGRSPRLEAIRFDVRRCRPAS